MGRLWRGWSAVCVAGGAVVVPLFVEVFAGGSLLRFAALPLRWLWIVGPAARLVAAHWLPPRVVAGAVAAVVLALTAGTGADLAGIASLHPGWFLTLEWWQRPLWPYLDLLPVFHLNHRPGYLWVAWLWTLAEGALVVGLLARPSSAEVS